MSSHFFATVVTRSPLAALVVGALTAACSGGDADEGTASGGAGGALADAGVPGPWDEGEVVPASEQGHGDPVAGRQILLNGNFMSCGIPWAVWSDPALGPAVQGALGGGGAVEPLEGREGRNADLPYSLNVFTTADGAEVVNRNCLSCHGGHFNGELIVGLGDAAVDFTAGVTGGTDTTGIPDTFIDTLGLTEAEASNFRKVLRFGAAVGNYTEMRTVGQNPAEQLTGVLLSHHDNQTLEWSVEPLQEIAEIHDEEGNLVVDPRLTSDPPPWWRAHKKNALFYNAMARGDHRGTMALATAICVDTLEEAQRVDDLFRDMHAYVTSIRSPDYPFAIDDALAADGKEVFTASCSGCHGTYADDPQDDDNDTYPNLLLPLDVIGTDPAVARAPIQNAHLTDWYNDSFYGSVAPAVPDDPFPGYIAPPLDGVWAVGPFLHNGSVPTIELVLNSEARPKYWKRLQQDGALDSTYYDEEALGWPYEEVSTPQAEAPEAERKFIYDTTYYSQDNGGHTFGDHLTGDERRAVIEYLKTL